MSKFSAEEIQNFVRKINCMSDYDFADMYKAVLGQAHQTYINEKFTQCRGSFIHWICEMDPITLNKFMEYCLNK